MELVTVNTEPSLPMDKIIKFFFILFTLWVIVYAFMKFFPEYATQLPPSLYSFFYLKISLK